MTVLDFLIAAAVAVWFGAVVLHAVRRRRKGCGGCACGCSGCGGRCPACTGKEGRHE